MLRAAWTLPHSRIPITEPAYAALGEGFPCRSTTCRAQVGCVIPHVRGFRSRGAVYITLGPTVPAMPPVHITSPQCHLWTDALHLRQLASDARNKWDIGTYVRSCVTTAWSVLEIACNEALAVDDIGYSFRRNLEDAVQIRGLSPIDWSVAPWSDVLSLQGVRKGFVHRFLSTNAVFPSPKVAAQAIRTVRAGVLGVFAHAAAPEPLWVHVDHIAGYDTPSNFGTPVGCQIFPGARADDPLATRVCLVVRGQENVCGIFPSGHDVTSYTQSLLASSKVPLEGVRVYDQGALVYDLVTKMRASSG